MSLVRKCDKCGEEFYTDSRSEKGAYALVTTRWLDGDSTFDLCRDCYKLFKIDFLGVQTEQEFEEEFGLNA